MDEPQFSEQVFDRAAADLRRVIHAIAGRYLIRGLPLTWRLLHDIETEALADLGLAGRHCAELLALFVRPADYDYPYTDELVTISAGRRVPFIVWLVLDVYGVAALPMTMPAADMLDAL